jgi:hypothetical protein
MADEKDDDILKTEEVETKPELGVEEGIDDLKAKLAAAEARATAAERTAAEASNQVGQAQDEVQRSNLTVITGAIEQLNATREQLKAVYANAMAEGDFAKAADVNSAMIDNAQKLSTLETGKISIETAPRREARRAALSTDPVEAQIAAWGSNISQKSANWLRRHPEFITDPAKNRKMLLADNAARLNDIELDSDTYYAFVEKTLGIGHSDAQPATDVVEVKEEPVSAAAAPVRRRDAAPPPAAPANNGGGNNRGRTLTRQQAEAAKISGLSPEEYYAQLQRVERSKAN